MNKFHPHALTFKLPILAGATYLLAHLLLAEVWLGMAHGFYSGYLLWLMLLTLIPPGHAGKPLTATWLALPPLLLLMTYTPSGWLLPHKLLLVLLLAVLTLKHAHHGGKFPYPNALALAVGLSLALLLTYGLDRGVGLVSGGKRQPGGLIFPRYSHASYHTPEFMQHTRVNGYGFRGADVDLNPATDCRIMLLGDSFTYGWGVNEAESWAVLLEGALQQGGINAQVLNLGVPGGNTADYAALAAAAVPLLQPDVILVGVLQGDDMRQMSRDASPFPRSLTFGEAEQKSPLTAYLSFHYPYLAERTVLSHTSARATRQRWAATAQGFIAAYTPEQRARYTELDAELRGWFESGAVNPHFIQLAVTAPDYWTWPLQDPATLTPYIGQMAAHFGAVAAAAPAARTAVVSVPYGAYTQATAQDDLQRLGFELPPPLLQSTWVDGAVQQAAEQAGLPFHTVMAAFRTEAGVGAFYPVDGHFSPAGNRLFARTVAPLVGALCAPAEP